MPQIRRRVLVVDDDADLRAALETRLAAAGYEVRGVGCGEDALLACSPTPPDIVLLDVSMPGMDGFDVCERIRNSVDSPDMTIVFLTGTTHAGTGSPLAQMSTQSGGDYFIAKPFDTQLLLALLERITSDADAIVAA